MKDTAYGHWPLFSPKRRVDYNSTLQTLVTFDIDKLIETLTKQKQNGISEVKLEGTLFVVEDKCWNIIGSSKAQM